MLDEKSKLWLKSFFDLEAKLEYLGLRKKELAEEKRKVIAERRRIRKLIRAKINKEIDKEQKVKKITLDRDTKNRSESEDNIDYAMEAKKKMKRRKEQFS